MQAGNFVIQVYYLLNVPIPMTKYVKLDQWLVKKDPNPVKGKKSRSREGVIIECPLIYLFHDTRDIILTSRNDVRGIPSEDNDNKMLILTIKRR